MKKKLIILAAFIPLLITGCAEIISVTGVFINRLDHLSDNVFEIKVSVHDSYMKQVKDFEITVIETRDSLCIFNPKRTSDQLHVSFVSPDEQINRVSGDTAGLLVIAFHPYLGKFMQEIPAARLHSAEPILIEFDVGVIPDNINTPEKTKYLKFRY